MSELTAVEIAYCGLVLVASFAVRGGIGFGAAALPLIALVLPMKLVVPVFTVLGIFSSWSIVFNDSRHVEWRELLRLSPYTVAGSLVGLYFYNEFDARTLARGLGAFVLAYGISTLWQSLRRRPSRKWPRALALPVAGTLAGIVGTIFGAMAGIFYAIYLDMQKLDKHKFRATVAATLLVLGVVRGAGYFAVGAYDREALIATVISLPLMYLGVALGNRIHTNLSEIAFRRVLSVVLIGSGVPLMLG
ncbi:MAG TPA: sulfite exporter TauE/SafE family protein [Rhizomicrobium sp.]|nr:sulfite exporter TauE/SafE family protein [Rhizomicrobium sp.]